MTGNETSEQIVYISCVEDVRYSFVSHLSEALRRKGIDVFVDSDDLLSKEAQEKVNGARVSVMVLPGNRDPTPACLGKILRVLDCERRIDQMVVPVLYGIGTLEDDWRRALQKISGLSQVHQSRKECTDSKLVEEIVRDVYEKLYHIGRIGIYPKLLEIEQMICKQQSGICCVGIWGMPGIGKTTLAKAVFDQMSGAFDARCFIEDYDKAIREKGLYRVLEEQFLKENHGAGSTSMKLSLLREKLNNKKVLVVLDDVYNPLAADSFLRGCNWFGPESLIIITSRDKQVFRLCRVDHIYEVQGLNEKEALQLFSSWTSTNDMAEQNLHKLSMEVIEYANGNPLALSIYGRELKGKKELSEMQNAFLFLKRRPLTEIVDVVKSSYDTLSDSEKNIFLDIACFFRGENVDYVMQLLEGCDFYPHVGVDVLVDKCLVTFSEKFLQMHNLIKDVGCEIINGETVHIERRRRLWEPWSIKYLLEDNEHKTTFKRAQGTEDIEGIFLDTSSSGFDVKSAAFKDMLNLRLLKIYNSNSEIHPVFNFPKGGLHSLPRELRLLHWENYPLQFLPQSFDPMHLIEINMPYSQLQKLWGGTKNLEMLRIIRLCHSEQLVDIDDLLNAQNLEVIDLQGCTKLQNFPATGQMLHLQVVNLSGCTEIKIFPEVPPNIETLRLQGTGIIGLPLSIVKPNGGELESLLAEFHGLSDALKLEHVTNLVKSSSSCQDHGKLICLDLKDCSCLRSLPNMVNLEFLKVLDLSGCSELETIQAFPRNLIELYIAGTAVREVPQLPQSLELLNAHGCVSLKSISFHSEQLPMHYTFSNCFDLSPHVVDDFLVKALANVKHIPKDDLQELNEALAFSFCAPSHVNQNSTLDLQLGSSVMTWLAPSSRSTLVGFAMLVEVAFSEDYHDATGFGISCVCRWKNKEGCSQRLERTFPFWAPGEAIPKLQKDHIFVFCDFKMRPSTGEGNDPDILADLVVFEFFPVNKQRKHLDDSCTVTSCKAYVIDTVTGNTNLKMSSPCSSLNPEESSRNDGEEVLKVIDDDLQKIDKALFLYIVCLFNDEDVDLVAPLIPSIDLDISYGLNALANKSLIHLSSNGEIMMNSLVRKIGKDILQRQSMLSGSAKDSTQDVSMGSSSSSHSFKYDVFPSFSGKDVRKTFLSHLLQVFKSKGITTFIENEIGRGQLISDLLVRGIKESRMSIVVLSKNYVSSIWNLNELVEITNRKEDLGQKVIPIFYDVDPSDVKKQKGEFGLRFKQTCKNRTVDEKQQWCQALTDIANLPGYFSGSWDNEADMMEAIVSDVLKNLNITTSKDFGDIVEDHISKMNSLMCLESEEVRMIGIWGPPGIGKSTIARALYSQLARQFRRSIFVDKAFVYKIMKDSTIAKLDDYDTKLRLQAQFLSEVLGQKQIKVHHLGTVKEWLNDQKVLIILDDVDDLVLLDALARDTRWFGSGSRIIVTTRDKHLLRSHGITHIYNVDIPSKKQALQMFCQSAFRQNSPPDGFMELANKVVQLAGNLPLGLSVLGSSLRGKSKEHWMDISPGLRDILEQKIKKTLGGRHESGTELGKSLPSLSPFRMASYSSHTWRYDVFLSFCGQDIRRAFLSHFLLALKSRSIVTFNDHEVDRGQSMSGADLAAIRDSRISIVVISRRYVSSSWLLNELVEIAKCKKELTQKLIPIFYDVDPSDVRNQTGEFGMHFHKTCYGKTEEEKKRWCQTLINIANIPGFCSLQWDNEADMIENIVNDVSNSLSFTPSIDSHGLVGIKAHIANMNKFLCLESEEVKMVGIWGQPGIGKTTIARALYIELSSRFQLSAFLSISSNDKRTHSDDYGAKLHFQELLLSNIFRQKDIKIAHLGMVEDRLKDKKVLIILDDVDDILLLEALAGQTRWFGSGSRIIVTTRDKGLLKSHGIDDIYNVGLPSNKQALEMFCQFAFAQKNPPEGFMELAVEVVKLAGNLPLGLRVLGSYLRGQDKTSWTNILPQIRNKLHGKIEKILRVTYDGLDDHDKVIFLNIACLFNHDTVESVTRLLADSDWNVVCRLRSLAEKSVIHITEHGNITMHHLQQNLGREIVRSESYAPGERRYLVDSGDIRDVFADGAGTESVLGISLDISSINALLISERGFRGMKNLQFLKIYTNLENKEVKKEVKVHIPDGLDYLSHELRLLHWEAFPLSCMPSDFSPVNLVELTMEASKLEKLWDGAQPLRSLRCMSLRGSLNLREIPDLSCATSLEKLDFGGCSSLIMLPSSIGNLHRLKDLDMEHCINLEVLPTGVNLVSLYCLILNGCSQLRSFPEISWNISDLYLDGTAIEEVPWWIENISGLSYLSMNRCKKLKKISPNISKLKFLVEVDFSECEALTEDSWQNHPEEICTSLIRVDMSGNSFKRLSDTWTSIQPKDLILGYCRNLVSLPKLPASLSMLVANNCESLESLYGSFDYPRMALQFINCFNLNHQAREFILRSDCAYAILPGGEVPAYFTHRVDASFLTVPLPQISLSKKILRFRAFIVVASRSGWFYFGVIWHFRGGNDKKYFSCLTNTISTRNHIITFGCEFSPDEFSDPPAELNNNDVQFEFFCLDHKKDMIKIEECGIQLLEVLDDSSKISETEDGKMQRHGEARRK